MSRLKDFFPTPEDIPPAVQWHEGMLLAPQHFQQQSLRQEALLHYQLRQCYPFHWGIKRLKYDEGLLKRENFLRVTELEAVMPDGLVVSLDQAAGETLELKLDDENLKDLAKESQFISLVVLADKSSGAGSDGSSSRYREIQSPPLYDDYSKDLPLQIQQLVPWLRLCFGAPRGGDCALPLLELRKRVAGAQVELSEFLAPRLDVPEDSGLGQICREVSDHLQAKIRHLHNALKVPAATSGGAVQEGKSEMNRRLLCHLIAGLPAFEAVRRTGLCHPFTLYTALCSLAGHVAAVGYDVLPPKLLVGYRHEDPQRCFSEVAGFILRCLQEGVPESYSVNYFQPTGKGFELPFSKDWLHRKLVLGVVGPERASAEEIQSWAKNCFIGSDRGMDAMHVKRDPGVRREHLSNCPELAPWGRMFLFELLLDKREDVVLFHADGNQKLRIEHVLQGVPQEPHPAQLVLFVSKSTKQHQDSKS